MRRSSGAVGLIALACGASTRSNGDETGGNPPGCVASTCYPTEPLPPVRTVHPLECRDPVSGRVETKLLPPDGARGFGNAVALEGDVLVALDWHSAHVFRHQRSSWELASTIALTPHATAQRQVLALSGDVLAVGLSQTDAHPSGSVSIYRLGNDGALLEQELVRAGGADDLYFGGGLALDGTTLAVTTTTDVAVYERQASGFVEIQRITARSDGVVALKGDVLAIRDSEITPPPCCPATVSLYRRQGGFFELARTLTRDPAIFVGYELALGDDFLVVGGPEPYVYESPLDGGRDLSLPSVNVQTLDADGSTILVGENRKAQLYQRESGRWYAGDSLTLHDSADGYFLDGAQVLSGDRVAIGVRDDWSTNPNAGAVYVFDPFPEFVGPGCGEVDELPPAIAGAGTGCFRPGSLPLDCRFLSPGESSVTGATPWGPLSLPFAYSYASNDSVSVVFSTMAPRGSGTRPSLTVWSPEQAPIPLGVPLELTVELELCDRTEQVPGVVRFDTGTPTETGIKTPLSGELLVDADGWSLSGRFQVAELCGERDEDW